MYNSFRYIVANDGIDTQESYPSTEYVSAKQLYQSIVCFLFACFSFLRCHTAPKSIWQF